VSFKLCKTLILVIFPLTILGYHIIGDAPPHSLKDSNVSPKMETMKKKVGVRFLCYNISGVERAMLELRDGDYDE
jgi:hypothetical protein